MTDNRPRWTKGNLALIGPFAILLVIGAVLLAAHFLGQTAKVRGTAGDNAVNAAAPAAVEAKPSVIGRSELLAAAAAAASAYAAGKPIDPPSSVPGARFKIEIPVGCEGPQLAAPSTQVAEIFDPLDKSVRLTAQAAEWSTLPVFLRPDGKSESVEGFWIPRPWTSFEGCPAKSGDVPGASPTPPPYPTVGLAQIFAKDESRVGQRRSRPYELVRKVPEDAPQTVIHPYGFILEGVIAVFPDGKTIRCWSESADHRPICVFAVRLDHVAFRDPGAGKPLADWPG